MTTTVLDDLQLFLDRLAARSVLSAEEQAAILALPTTRIDVRAHTDIVRPNEKIEVCCYVAAGLVARVGQTANGARQITALHVPGDLADLHSAVRPIGIGGLTALTDSVILRIPHVAVRRCAARYPAVAEAFWRDCMLDTAALMEWVINLGRRAALPRLAHLLCEMGIRYGHGQVPLLTYGFPITQEQLADAAGLTGVHVNRSLRTLREWGLVTFRSGIVSIADWDALAKLAEFDPAYLLADTAPERQQRLMEAA